MGSSLLRWTAAVVSASLASGVWGCFYDWRYHPPDEGEGGAGAVTAASTAAVGGAGPGGCAACTQGMEAASCSPNVAECIAYEDCAAQMGCDDPYSCFACIMGNQDGFNRWACLDALCGDACAGVAIPCG